MMMKKLFAVLLCLAIFTLAGCTKVGKDLAVESGEAPVSQSPEPKIDYSKNPLTGLHNLTGNTAKNRPVAIMINNIREAQGVQTGVGSADIVYETEVEGGITRLLAVYQNIEAVGQIGSIRSARYPYIDLAMGNNAIYVHCGEDPNYAKPHLRDTDHVSISESNYGTRISNGLSSEHTLYTFGDKIWKGLVNAGWKTENTKLADWQTFAKEDAPVSFEMVAGTVGVPFSLSAKTNFVYDTATGSYIRKSGEIERLDYITKQNLQFKNVFVLLTSIVTYPDGVHRDVKLVGGTGYYCVNGTYTEIKWSKGTASSPIVFTNTDGTPLTVNPGNSWVCIANTSTSQPVFG